MTALSTDLVQANEAVSVVPVSTAFQHMNSAASELEQPMYEQDVTLEAVNISEMNNDEDKLAFELAKWDHQDEDASLSISYRTASCPCVADRVPYCCILCCCCFWSRVDRKQCSLQILYTKFYLIMCILSILITIVLLVYDVSDGSIANGESDKEPLWFSTLDTVCISLMVFDITIQIQAHGLGKFCKSLFNMFDFIVVTICVLSIPIYWMQVSFPWPEWILSLVLLTRFIVRMLRIISVIRHQKLRKEYISARDSIVDFTKYNERERDTSNRSEQFL